MDCLRRIPILIWHPASCNRPEHQAPPEIFYDESEARKYTTNSRIIEIQEQMTNRALELLALPTDQISLILDLGCGSGLSGEAITEAGHQWIGFDISKHMLDVAVDREVDGDLLLHDLGQGLGLRPGAADGAVSISALQWLCNADKASHNPAKRLSAFFASLYAALARGSRAVFQFYPENDAQVSLITQQAMRAGFSGGLVVDYPNSAKAKKIFLCLMTGGGNDKLPKGLGAEEKERSRGQISFSERKEKIRNLKGAKHQTHKSWVLEKKERRLRQGKETKRDSKYTGRKRSTAF